jgi:hypothetical protein
MGMLGFGGSAAWGVKPACPSSGAIIAVWFCWFGSVVRFHCFVFGDTVARSFPPGLGGAFWQR